MITSCRTECPQCGERYEYDIMQVGDKWNEVDMAYTFPCEECGHIPDYAEQEIMIAKYLEEESDRILLLNEEV